MSAVTVTVPGQPVSWRRAVFDSRTRRYITPHATEDAETWVGTFLRQAFPNIDEDHEWSCKMWFYSKDNRKRDVDRMANLVLDAAQGIVWRNDAQVMEIYARHRKKQGDPRTVIVLEVLG